jgi:hypothetical protein
MNRIVPYFMTLYFLILTNNHDNLSSTITSELTSYAELNATGTPYTTRRIPD